MELEREIVKAKRTGEAFVLAFVDVDGLKAKNDSQGHAAGDELLRRVAETIRGTVREYDLVVRYGGDEFLCGFMGLSLAEAARRFEVTKTDLAASQHASFTVGLAMLGAHESLDDLIERADAAMYAARENHRAE